MGAVDFVEPIAIGRWMVPSEQRPGTKRILRRPIVPILKAIVPGPYIQSEKVASYMKHIRRGEIYSAALGNTVGSEQGGLRPVLIVQRSRLCRSSPTVIVAPITSHLKYPFMRAHHVLDESCPLHERSMVLAEQIRAIDKRRLRNYVGRLKAKDMLAVGQALRYSLGLCQ